MIFFQIIVILKELHLENIVRGNQYEKAANKTVLKYCELGDITVTSIYVYGNYY